MTIKFAAFTKKTVPIHFEVRQTKALVATGAYAANDVLSQSPTAGTVWTFDAVGSENSAYGYITKAEVVSESESVTPRLTVFLFNATPTGCNLNDNVANTAPDNGDLAKNVGHINFPSMESLGTTDSVAVATPNTPNSNLPLAFKCAAADDALYGVLVTRTAFTQSTGDDLTIILHVEQAGC